jgi:hypothetical protein
MKINDNNKFVQVIINPNGATRAKEQQNCYPCAMLASTTTKDSLKV